MLLVGGATSASAATPTPTDSGSASTGLSVDLTRAALLGEGPVGEGPVGDDSRISPALDVTVPGVARIALHAPAVTRLLHPARQESSASPATDRDAQPARTPSTESSRHTGAGTTVPPTAGATGAALAPGSLDTRPAPSADRTVPSASSPSDTAAGRVQDRSITAVRPKPKPTKHTTRVRPAADSQLFEVLPHASLPTWLVGAVLALCAGGTLVVVRGAGRRASRA